MTDKNLSPVLPGLLKRWATAMHSVEALESQIKELIPTNKRVELDAPGARLIYNPTGKSKTNYEDMGKHLEPDDDVVKKYTKEVIDWKSVCQEVGYSDELAERFTKSGNPTYTFKLVG